MATVSTGVALDLPFAAVSLTVSREVPVAKSVTRDPFVLLIKRSSHGRPCILLDCGQLFRENGTALCSPFLLMVAANHC